MNTPNDFQSISKRLKAETHAAHEALDSRIMASDPFSTKANYVQFLLAQWRFHATIEPLFQNAALLRFIPDWVERRRLHDIERDLIDLSTNPGADSDSALIDFSGPAAVWGWAYVAEGSKLGAAILLKKAEKLGLSDTFGARHLAAHHDGRAKHWRSFTEALDTRPWTEQEQQEMIEAARLAFMTMLGFVERQMPLTVPALGEREVM